MAFGSGARNLISGDTNGIQDIFIYDRQLHKTTRVSLTYAGTQAYDGSYNPSISANGHVVAFTSKASDLVMYDTNKDLDIFAHEWFGSSPSINDFMYLPLLRR